MRACTSVGDQDSANCLDAILTSCIMVCIAWNYSMFFLVLSSPPALCGIHYGVALVHLHLTAMLRWVNPSRCMCVLWVSGHLGCSCVRSLTYVGLPDPASSCPGGAISRWQTGLYILVSLEQPWLVLVVLLSCLFEASIFFSKIGSPLSYRMLISNSRNDAR